MFSAFLFKNKELPNPVEPSHVVWVPDVGAILFILGEMELGILSTEMDVDMP